jgi:hypothetical protein
VPDLPTLNFKEIEINEIIININSKEATFNVTKEALIRKNQEKELLISFQKKAKLFTSPKYKSIIKKLSHAYRVLTDEKEKYLGELFEIAIGTYNNFETLDKNTCLLCNTSNLGDKKNTFSSIVERRILKYNKFKEEYSNFKNSFKTLIDTCDLLTLENYLVSKNFITKKVISEFYYTNEIIDKQVFEDSKYPELLIFYLTILKDQTKLYEIEIKDLRKQIPEGLIAVITKLSNYTTIQLNIKETESFENSIIANKKYIYFAERWAQFITTVKDNFILNNNKLMKEIASDISTDTQKFFQEIMMTPEIIPRIEKKDAGQKILMLLQNFYSINDKKAASLLSESYRNAFCLSIYFACALKNKSSSGFIILDDITSSFDGGHQRYLLLLIKNKISRIFNKKGKQVILFTHDGELEKSLKAYKQETPKWNHYRIHKESNIKIDIKEIDISQIGVELKRKAAQGDNVSLEIRKYFESIVLEIHKHLKIPMTYDLANNRDDRMLHALLTNLRNILKLYRGNSSIRLINSLPTDVDIIDILNLEKEIANIISHFESQNASSYTPAFIVGVINKIEAFNKKFQYNCTCAEVGAGIVYFAGLNSKKRGKCTC